VPTVDLPERLNIAHRFLDARVAEGRGDRVALRTPEGELTYREVQALAHRFANVLLRQGVRPEERVLISLPDGAEFVAALFGILEIGAVAVMVNPAFDAEAVRSLLEYTGAGFAVVSATGLDAFEESRSTGHRLRGLLTVGVQASRHPSWEEERELVDGWIETVDTHRDDPAVWLFSGGTTGRPKAVVQTHRSFAHTTDRYARDTLGYRQDDVTISVPKLYFGYATGSNLFFPFSVGASAVLFPEHPTAQVLFERIERFRPTILVNVPTMIQRMLSDPSAGGRDLSSLRFATSAGEALPAPLYAQWKERFGVELLDGLGTAEMWHIFVTNRPGDVRPGTLGRVVDGFEVEIRDEAGEPVPRGDVGRLWVRGDSRAWGYWRNLDKTRECFRGEWFVGGDLASMDDEGYVTYCGRGDDVMKVGGKWCSPGEVEAILVQHPAVAECAVIGAENEEGLTKPYAFVVPATPVPDSAALEEELKGLVLERLAPYKHPRRVFLVDDLPRTHLGKVDRGVLRARLDASAGSDPPADSEGASP
jgi:benzoate-CoA ligase family protein